MNRQYAQLRNGVQMPWIGVWTPERDDTTEAIEQALEVGYRSKTQHPLMKMRNRWAGL